MARKSKEFADILSPSDVKTRKWWLRLTLAFGASVLLGCLDVGDKISNDHVRTVGEIIIMFALVIAQTIMPLLSLYIPYHCGYKYPGTKWLMFILIMGPLTILTTFKEIMGEFSQSGITASDDPISFYLFWGFMMIPVFIIIAWLIMTAKLRAVNMRIKKAIEMQDKKELEMLKVQTV